MNKIYPVSGIIHSHIARIAKKYNPSTIIDMGGVGKLKWFINIQVTDINILVGTDATKLSYDNNSFDLSVSIATLEHVKNMELFLEESFRVARIGMIHWAPLGKDALKVEKFKKEIGAKHPCVIFDLERVSGTLSNLGVKNIKMYPFQTGREQLLLLASKDRRLNRFKIYDFINDNENINYGYIIMGEK